ncbi:hypothetical protein Tco_0102786 [Tanacetum coccineum]
MHSRASNSELFEPLLEPKRILNQKLRRRNRRVPFNQRHDPPQTPRIIYPQILNINHFCYFLVILENHYLIDDDHVVAPTANFENHYLIKEVPNAAAGGIFLFKTPNQAYQLLEDKVLLKLDWAKNQKTKSSLKKTVAFADGGSNNSDTDKIMVRMDAMTLKMDAQYKELESNAKKTKPDLDEDDIPTSREEAINQRFRQGNIHGS